MDTSRVATKKRTKKRKKSEWKKLLEALPPSVYLSDKDLTVRFRNSRASIWRWIETRGLPKPIQISPGCTRWRLADVEQWEATLSTK